MSIRILPNYYEKKRRKTFAWSKRSEGFSVVAPELAVPGKTTAVLVTLHGPLIPVNVTLRLLGDGAEELNQQLVETTQEIRADDMLYAISDTVTSVRGFIVPAGDVVCRKPVPALGCFNILLG
ncbi:hypothetical protein CBL_07750 [Carabus blaptoides fortunei]